MADQKAYNKIGGPINFEVFINKFLEDFRPSSPIIEINQDLTIESINSIIDDIEILEPFGVGNDSPILKISDIIIYKIDII